MEPKKNLTDMLEGGAKSSGNPCADIAALLFKAVTDAHITHLMNPDKTLAKHTAMSIFYEAIPDLLDGLVETSMGIYDIKDIPVATSRKIGDALSYFQSLYNQIETLRTGIKESFLQNQVDTIQEEIAHCMYRLKYIQS